MTKRYQRGNQNLYIKEEQTTQWSKEKVQKDKQRSTKHTYKTKDRVTQTPLRDGPFNFQGGRYVFFFFFLNILFPNVAEQNELILVEGKKIWFRFLSYIT